MSKEIRYIDLGLMEYGEAWQYQEKLFNEILDAKKTGSEKQNYLLFCEHPHVFTLGKSGSESNLLINNLDLQQKGVSFFKTNRGGDITYHGPGQIVGYPILDLEEYGLGIRAYIELLEESIILLLKEYGITASRLDGASGTWLDAGSPEARKICAIGVKSSRYVSMHGFAFNVNTQLDFYNHINPCGFVDKGVTSLEKELGEKQDFHAIKARLRDIIISLLLKT
jgi:lipoyl(octanoyl) transferase